MGALEDWVKQDWVRIGTDGKIKGKCGTSKDKKNPDRCLPRAKANKLSQSQRASTARKKKAAGSEGKTVVANTPSAKVSFKASNGGAVPSPPKRKFKGKKSGKGVVAKGCGIVMPERRKRTKGAVTQFY